MTNSVFSNCRLRKIRLFQLPRDLGTSICRTSFSTDGGEDLLGDRGAIKRPSVRTLTSFPKGKVCCGV
jgi:hypothetical protein